MPDPEIVNTSGIPDEQWLAEPKVQRIIQELAAWGSETQRPVEALGMTSYRPGGRDNMFDRQRFVHSGSYYDDLRIARDAVRDDDVIAGAADVTEALALQGVKVESADPDLASAYNEIMADVDLDGFLRMAWRELFTGSQVIVGSLWKTKTFRVKGVATSRARRKTIRMKVPYKLFILDSSKVEISDPGVTGVERLIWNASASDMQTWRDDPVMRELILGEYGINQLELDPARVWRHTLTKSSYEKHPDVRLRSVFRLLDMKSQLMDADRASLAGNARYLLHFSKGSDLLPGTTAEIANMRDNYDVIAKMPVYFSDHRTKVEIISPKMDLTLGSERYDTLDRRIVARVFGSLSVASSGQRNESTLTTGRLVGRLLESRRHMLKRSFELNVLQKIAEINDVEHGRVTFVPNRIDLSSESQFVLAVFNARARGDLSRESFLEFLGYSQEAELQRRMYEIENTDDIFQTHEPFTADPNQQGLNGAAGGKPAQGDPGDRLKRPNVGDED